MTLSMINQSIQFIAWLIAIIELILGLYVLVLNAWHRANRHASALLLVVGVNTFAVGWMIGVINPVQAELPALLLAMTTPATQPLLFVAMIALVKPEWLLGRKRWIWWLFYMFTIIPVALTLYDQLAANRLWFSGLPSNYTGGFISLAQFTQGLIADYIRWVALTLLPALAISLLLYLALIDKHILGGNRRLARLLLIAQVTSYLIAKIFSPQLVPAAAAITPITLIVAAFGYTVLQQIISERRIQRGSLQARLTASLLVVTLPLLISVTAFVNWRAGAVIKNEALNALIAANRSLSNSLTLWLESNVHTLDELAAQPEINSTDTARQKPILDMISELVTASQVGDGGVVYIVDDKNRVFFPHPSSGALESLDFSAATPLQLVRSEFLRTGSIVQAFTDAKGIKWHASASLLENGWVVIVQRPERELLAGAVFFQRVSLISLAIGALLLFFMSWLTIRHAIQPIEDLTNTANGVASGDLTRVAMIQSEDELGALARAFNGMITQVRESITNLERRVIERNRDIERRSIQLQLSADVARQSVSISGLDQLLDRIVRLISDRFNLYHTGIFIIDEEGDHIVLRAASSPGGRRMLARNYKLPIDQTTIVGYVAEKGKLLISQDVDKDTLISKHVDLPQTRSEMALPLRVREHLVGVIDVHSNKGTAFSNEDIETLQILSDQVAIAIDHAMLQTMNEELSRELGLVYQQQLYQSWHGRLEAQAMTYAYRSGNVTKEFPPAAIEESAIQSDRLLKLPIVLRDHTLGWITLRRHHEAQAWSDDEIDLVKETLTQIALALENARLLEENQQRAKNEALVGYITGKTQGLLDVESVMKTAVREIGRSLGLTRVQISLSSDEPTTTASQTALEAQEQ